MKRAFRKRERSEDDSDDDAKAAPAALLRPVQPTGVSFSSSAPAGPSAPSGAPTIRGVGGVASTASAAPHAYGGGAFSYSQRDAPADRDGRALLERKLALQATGLAELNAGGPRLYRGAAGYTDFHVRDAVEAVAAAKRAGTLGPARAPANVRGICRIDYAPDVCKDWKETGQCPFGDSCKYIHDRSDYKSGWQLELEHQRAEKEKQARLAARLAAGGTIEDASEGEEGGEAGATSGAAAPAAALPTACFICRGPFKSPSVQTRCGHCFCEACALARARTDPSCAVCGKATHGIFNVWRAAPEGAAAPEAAAEPDEAGDAAQGGGGGWGDAS